MDTVEGGRVTEIDRIVVGEGVAMFSLALARDCHCIFLLDFFHHLRFSLLFLIR